MKEDDYLYAMNDSEATEEVSDASADAADELSYEGSDDAEDPILESAFSIHTPPVIESSESVIDTGNAMTDASESDSENEISSQATDNTDKIHLDNVEIAPLVHSESSGDSVRIPQSVLGSISVDVRVELGETHINLNQLYTLKEGQILELDRELGDPLDVVVNGQVIAKCEIVSINYRYAIRIIELVNKP